MKLQLLFTVHQNDSVLSYPFEGVVYGRILYFGLCIFGWTSVAVRLHLVKIPYLRISELSNSYDRTNWKNLITSDARKNHITMPSFPLHAS